MPRSLCHGTCAQVVDKVLVPLTADDENHDWGSTMGRRYGGWLGWDELLTRRRVVLLAEPPARAQVEDADEIVLQAHGDTLADA